MSQVKLEHLYKRFGNVTAVGDFNLDVKDGEFISFLGPSGCGKTTTLRMIAGFERPTEGSIILGDTVVSSASEGLFMAPEKRDIGMVFQSYAVWPHMTVAENVAYPLKIQGVSKAERDRRVEEALKMVHLDQYGRRYPNQLSGGQQQRVALARALIAHPGLLLLDEPLSNLDAKLRESMRFEIKALQEKFGFTIIFVTHDQSEAMAISDRMMVCDMGNIVQIDTPENLYNKPCNRFVHSFLGQSTFLHVYIRDNKVFAKGDDTNPLPLQIPENVDREMVIATRPNEIDLNRTEGYKTAIESRIFLTDTTQYIVRIGDQYLTIQTPHRITFNKGETCYVKFPNVMWYPEEDPSSEEERAKRQTI